MEFAKDKNAIEVGEFVALPAIIDTLAEAVCAGEFDVHRPRLPQNAASCCAR
jgi:hypothetical protein